MKLEVDSVYYQVGEKTILSDIHLAVSTGEILGILGRNGSGKSSLFKLMFGLTRAESFQLRIDGVAVKRIYNQGLLQYLPQHDFLPDHFRIGFTLDLYKINPDGQKYILELLREERTKKLGVLSGGKRRLFEVMLLLNSKAPFLILDEPFTGLTPLVVEQMTPLIQQAAVDKGILITDHLYQPIISISDRLMLMTSGALKSVSGIDDLEEAGYLAFKE